MPFASSDLSNPVNISNTDINNLGRHTSKDAHTSDRLDMTYRSFRTFWLRQKSLYNKHR